MGSQKIKMLNELSHRFLMSYDIASLRFTTWASRIGKKYPESFYRKYREEFLPYWKRFGQKPSVSMAKALFDVTGDLEKESIPDDIWMRYIVPYFNDRKYASILPDKNLNGMIFPAVLRPETLFRRMSGNYCQEDFTRISKEKALALCHTPGEWVIKPANGSFQGRNVSFFNSDIPETELLDLLNSFGKEDFIVQRLVKQHPDMAKLNSSSVNTVRVVTAIFEENVFVDSTIIRIGTKGSRVDNIGAGGIQCGVREDGSLYPIAYFASAKEKRQDISTDSLLSSFVVPGIQNVWKTAVAQAAHMPHLNLIAWDFAINEDCQPVLIEFNTHMPCQNYETNGPSFLRISEKLMQAAVAERN